MRTSMLQAGTVSLAAASAAFGHGPQIQITNDNNKITTRQVLLDGPYNTAPNPTPATTVYLIPLASISAFGGTEWFAQPSPEAPVSDPGLAWGYGWSYTNSSTYTQTFPTGANFVESFTGALQQWNGSSFAPALHGAQLAGYRSTGPQAISGSGTPSFNYGAIAAPTAPNPEPHGTAYFQLIGDGIIPSVSHLPAAVDDGIYSAGLTVSLVNQPGTADPQTPNYDPAQPIQNSDTFYFVLYKGVSVDAALTAAQAAYPGASIQDVVPEPTSLASLAIVPALAAMRRQRRVIL